jgi:hypothetical protein
MRSKIRNLADTLPEYGTNPDQALAALVCLMSRFPARRSQAVAAAIIIHLRLIRDDHRLSLVIRDCADNLIEEWEAYAALCAPDAAILQWRQPN